MPIYTLHTQEEKYLRDELFNSCGGEKKRKVDVAKVQNILGNFPEIVNDEIGAERDRGTPLIYAVKSNSYELVRFLLTIPELNIYKADDEGWTALHWAVMKGNSDIVDAILGHHECSINSQNDASRTPLHIAAMTGTVNIARILLAHPKIKVQLKDKYGDTPLHLTVQSGHDEIAKLILQKDSIMHRNKDGQNPFHILCSTGKVDQVKEFLKYPIDIHQPERTSGKTALQLAQEANHPEIVRLLSDPELTKSKTGSNKCSVM